VTWQWQKYRNIIPFAGNHRSSPKRMSRGVSPGFKFNF